MSFAPIDPVAFAEEWVTAWNAHDVEAGLAHCHKDAIFSSPLARLVDPACNGVVNGKAALRHYWTTALGKNPNLAFELTRLSAAVDSLRSSFATRGAKTVSKPCGFEMG